MGFNPIQPKPRDRKTKEYEERQRANPTMGGGVEGEEKKKKTSRRVARKRHERPKEIGLTNGTKQELRVQGGKEREKEGRKATKERVRNGRDSGNGYRPGAIMS